MPLFVVVVSASHTVLADDDTANLIQVEPEEAPCICDIRKQQQVEKRLKKQSEINDEANVKSEDAETDNSEESES